MKENQAPPSTKTFIYLSTNIGKSCEICSFSFHGWYDIARQINHYLDHGYKVRHIGSETSHDEDGKPWHATVAVLEL